MCLYAHPITLTLLLFVILNIYLISNVVFYNMKLWKMCYSQQYFAISRSQFYKFAKQKNLLSRICQLPAKLSYKMSIKWLVACYILLSKILCLAALWNQALWSKYMELLSIYTFAFEKEPARFETVRPLTYILHTIAWNQQLRQIYSNSIWICDLQVDVPARC